MLGIGGKRFVNSESKAALTDGLDYFHELKFDDVGAALAVEGLWFFDEFCGFETFYNDMVELPLKLVCK